MLSTRFTEYGLTGTFFIITQFLIFFNLQESGIYENILQSIEHFNNSIAFLNDDNTHTLLTALAFVLVFVIGLSLDLLGSIFRIREMQCLAFEINKNKTWLKEFTDSNSSYLTHDYTKILSVFNEELSTSKTFATLIHKIKRSFTSLTMMYEADRIRSFFISYVLVHAGAEKSQLLIEQIHLWRTGRVISLIIWLFSIEMLFLVTPEGSNLSYWGLLVFGVALFSTLLATSAYQRMLTTLFSLMYILKEENKKDDL